MSGKGSGRRPQQVPDKEAQEAWDRVFGNKDSDKAKDGQPNKG